MMRLFIEPVDVWLFRDGKPFDAAADHRAQSLFPPYPSTMQGVIRSKVLALSGVDLDDYAHRQPAAQAIAGIIGWPGEGYGQLRLRGPFLAQREESRVMRYFPLPADVVKVKDGLQVLAPLDNSPFRNNTPGNLCPLWVRAEHISGVEGWLSEEELRKYLWMEAFALTATSALFLRESHFGIKLDDSVRRVEEGHLYEVEFIRPHKDAERAVGLWVEVNGPEPWPSPGLLGIGGEARAARYEVLPTEPEGAPSMPETETDGKVRFKVYFATPTYFKSGWQPKGGDWDQFFSGQNIRLVAASFGRPQAIGGARTDHKSQRSGLFQKPIRRYVPAGTVYFFETDGPVAYSGVPVTEAPEGESDLGQIGFGQIFIGRWQHV